MSATTAARTAATNRNWFVLARRMLPNSRLQADAEPPAPLIEHDARGQAQRQEHGHGRVARNLRRAREFRDAHRAEDDEPRRGPQREESHVISDSEAAERRVGKTVADEGDILEDDEDA